MSAAAPIPYIGSRISLISVSGIRYEGILFSIDPKQSTVALQNVRSFGTEGRRKDQHIPASNNVYDYIIFRGSDIKDLQVCEPPPQPAQSQPPNDPAIINAMQGPEGSMPSMYGYPGMYGYPYGSPYGQPMYSSPYGYPGAYPPRPHQMAPPAAGGAGAAAGGQQTGFPSMQPLAGALPTQQPAQPKSQQPASSKSTADDTEGTKETGSASAAGKVDDEEKPGDAGVVSSPAQNESSVGVNGDLVYSAPGAPTEDGGASKQEANGSAGSSLLGPYPGAGAGAALSQSGEKREREGRPGSSHRGGQRGGQRNGHGAAGAAASGAPRSGERRGGSSQPRTGGGHPHGGRPQGADGRGSGQGRSGGGAAGGAAGGSRYAAPQKLPEFDFEKANSKFDKEKIKEEVLKGATQHTADGDSAKEGEPVVAPPVVEKAYNKSTSFFDSISCEALDRLKEDADGSRSERRRHERSLNAETFGRAANDRRMHHRGGPRRYGAPGSNQSHGAAPATSNAQPTNTDARPSRGGYSSARGGYAAAVRGSSAPQKSL